MKIKNIIFIILILFLLLPNLALAAANEYYVVEDYKVDVVVNDDSSYDIVETIDVKYFDEKIDFYWNINAYPGYYQENTILDFFLFEASISDIKTNIDSNVVHGSLVSEIIIPSTSMSSSDTEQFIISYTINHTKDLDKENDYFMLDVIKEFNVPINHFKFTITMPFAFDKSNVIVRKGNPYSVYEEDFVVSNLDDPNFMFYVDNNKIIGEYNEFNLDSEIVAIFLQLPEGYFVNSQYNLENVESVKISIVLLSISVFIFVIFRKYKKGTKDVVYNPYDGMSCLESAYLYKKRKIKFNDIYTVFLSLANKGYIDVYDEGSINSIGGFNFYAVKNKSYAGNDPYEKMLFDRLFFNSDKIDGTMVKQAVVAVYSDMKKELKRNCKKYYTSNIFLGICNFLLMVMDLVVYYFIIEMFLSKLGGFAYSYLDVVLLCSLPLLLLFIRGGLVLKILFIFIASQFLFIFYGIAFMLFGMFDFGLLVILSIILIIIYILYSLMPNGKIINNDVSYNIYGLKNLIKSIDVNQFREMMAKDSNYFYNILPYSYVYGMSYNWFKYVSNINMETPYWYHTRTKNNIPMFNTFINALFYGKGRY